ncbi:MAG: cellulose binding domain-containing protein [Massilia sp.]
MRLKKMVACLTTGLLMATCATAENYHWDNVAMGGGGFVSGIITSKSERGVVYARTDVGGAYRYDARAGRWIALTDWVSESDTGLMGVESLAVDPKNAANVYMLAGTEYFSNGKTAILRSTDYGKHVEVIDVSAQFKAHGNGMGRSNGEKLQVDPASGNVLFVGTRHNGLFKSVDSGATWSHLDGLNVGETPNGNGISFVLLDPASVSNGTAKRIYVGVSRYGSVGPNLYLSKDGGATFAPVAGAPASLMPQRAAITSKGRLYFTYANGAGPHWQSDSEPMSTGAVWEYNTVGGVWTNVTPFGRTHPFGGVSVDASNPKHLVVSTANQYWTQQQLPTGNTYGDRIYTSYDAGRTWADVVDRGMSIDPNGAEWARTSMIQWAGAIEFDPFDPKSVWVVSGNGLFKTSDIDAPKTSWKFDVHGMEETGSYTAETVQNGALVSAIGDFDGFINAAPDQYGVRHSPSMGTTPGLAIAPQAQQVMARAGNAIYTSADGGTSWTKAASMNGWGGNLALSADGFALLHTPDNSSTTYRSTDLGSSWTPATGLAVKNARPVADPVNPSKFYVYDSATGKVMLSSDGGVSFNPMAQLAGGGSTFLRATPGREGDLWACLGQIGLSHSTDSGASFTRIDGIASCGGVGLGKQAPAAAYPTLYMWGKVGTVRGLLRSTDQGASWVRVNDDAHQYGAQGSWVNGDMSNYCTVYMTTNGRGIAFGKIDPAGDVVVVPQVYVAPPKPAECKYTVYGGNFAVVSVTNTSGEGINAWTVHWSYADDTKVGDTIYNGFVTGPAPNYTGTDGGGWNHYIGPGQTVSLGFGFSPANPLAVPAVTGDLCK